MSTFDRYVGDKGMPLDVSFGAECPSLTAATAHALAWKPKSNRDAAPVEYLLTDLDNGAKTGRYTWLAGDIDEPGNWVIQGRVTTSSGAVYHGAKVVFRVGPTGVLR